MFKQRDPSDGYGVVTLILSEGVPFCLLKLKKVQKSGTFTFQVRGTTFLFIYWVLSQPPLYGQNLPSVCDSFFNLYMYLDAFIPLPLRQVENPILLLDTTENAMSGTYTQQSLLPYLALPIHKPLQDHPRKQSRQLQQYVQLFL